MVYYPRLKYQVPSARYTERASYNKANKINPNEVNALEDRFWKE